MAGAEQRGGAASGRSRSAGDHHGAPYLGLALAVLVLARAPAAPAQTPAAPPPGGGGASAGTPPGGADTGTANPGTANPNAPAPGPEGAAITTTPAAAALRTPAWTYLPAVAVDEAATDNVFSTATQRRSDLITTLAPSLFVSGESVRLKGVFDYSPQLVKYLDNTSQDQIAQNLFTDGTLTAVPDRLFFDAHAAISNQSRLGGRGFDNAAQIPSSQSTQTIAYTGSPYLRFHFGDAGDAELRYAFSQTAFDGNTGPVTNSLTGQNLGALSNATQHAASAAYNTGAAFARLQLGVLSSYTLFNSGGGLDSRHATGTANATYAVTDRLYALLGGGYERLVYPQQPQADFSGPDWDVGARYQPREDRQVTLTYGATEGQKAFTGSMLYAVTGDATLSASYSQQNSSAQQQILQNLGSSTQFVPGIPVNAATALPQAITNPNLALQNSVFRAQNLEAGLTVNRQRNRYTAQFNRTVETGLGAGSLSQTSTGGTASWGRDLTPNATGLLSAGYATTTASGAGAGATNALTFGVAVTYALSETLSAGANYALARQTGGGSGAVMVDILSVSLRKTF